MINVSFAENQSSLSGPNTTEAASGAISSISGYAHYRLTSTNKRAYYTSLAFPLTGGAGTTYLSLGGGAEFYFGGNASRYKLTNTTTTLVVNPTFRYYLGVEGNLAYIAYLTETAKKNDTLLEIGFLAGLSYSFGSWTLKPHLSYARGTGVNTTTSAIKMIVSGTIFLD